MSRDCDAIGCVAVINTGRFLCPAHWRMVPLATQQLITAKYRAGRKDFAFLSDIDYLQACADSVDGIAKAEGRAGASSYHRLLRVARQKASRVCPGTA